MNNFRQQNVLYQYNNLDSKNELAYSNNLNQYNNELKLYNNLKQYKWIALISYPFIFL